MKNQHSALSSSLSQSMRFEPAFIKYSLEFQEEGKETTEGKRASPGIAFSNSI